MVTRTIRIYFKESNSRMLIHNVHSILFHSGVIQFVSTDPTKNTYIPVHNIIYFDEFNLKDHG